LKNLRKVAVMNGRKEEGERLTTEASGVCGRKARNVLPATLGFRSFSRLTCHPETESGSTVQAEF
jgi:hypothetical protein